MEFFLAGAPLSRREGTGDPGAGGALDDEKICRICLESHTMKSDGTGYHSCH